MRVLALEGTAWAASAAIVEVPAEVLSTETAAYAPESGGIHPREAAEHMSTALPSVLETVLADEGTDDLDAVAFSRGPGLGPCLRIVGTVARTAAQEIDVPLVGVNHMVAHLEVGRVLSGFADPVGLNASGANAHVLGQAGDRYRVLGETMDTGVGNAIDKFARRMGWAHPGGPIVEDRARDGTYTELPYVVKGMDFSFSGLTSAAIDAVEAGDLPVADVCYSLQETVFAMLAEVSERALALTGRDQLVLGGGVGQNHRLQEMLAAMCAERGAACFVPPDEFLRDNAAMIGIVGAKMAAVGQTIPIAESTIRADWRPDEVRVSWRPPREPPGSAATDARDRGAEAEIERRADGIVKTRTGRGYRHPALDDRLRRRRTAAEARLTSLARREGVPTPVLREIDPERAELVFEFVGAGDLRDGLSVDRVGRFGSHLARLHGAGMVHGDPTPRNARVPERGAECERLYLIDFGLGYHSSHLEDRAMDLHVAGQSLDGTAATPDRMRAALERGYRETADAVGIDAGAVLERLHAIAHRGRYR